MDRYLDRWVPAGEVDIPPLPQAGFSGPVLRRAPVEPLNAAEPDAAPETVRAPETRVYHAPTETGGERA